ncbi:MAG: hypothetical protein IT329_15560 [Caldilineaceae bacterium]|nr:hypothetical protein [Caldilineaceae bacterium]
MGLWPALGDAARRGAQVGFTSALVYGAPAVLYIVVRSSLQILSVLSAGVGSSPRRRPTVRLLGRVLAAGLSLLGRAAQPGLCGRDGVGVPPCMRLWSQRAGA